MSFFGKFRGKESEYDKSCLVSTVNHLSRLGGEPPKLKGWEFLTHMRPLEHVGGDFLHWYNPHSFKINQRIVSTAISKAPFTKSNNKADLGDLIRQRSRVGLSLVDVMDHGMDAAKYVPEINDMLIKAINSELKQKGNVTTDLGSYFEEYEDFAKDSFFSMIYSEFNKNGKFNFFSMGHHPPSVWDIYSKKLTQLKSDHGSIIGAFDVKVPDKTTSYEIKKGQIVILSSDGLTEHGINEYSCFFPLEAIISKIQGNSTSLSLPYLKEGLKEEMKQYAPFTDDVTFVFAKKL